MKIINFQHRYYKLDEPQFHTIRSKSNYKVGDIVDIQINNKSFCEAQIYQICSGKIKYLPYEFVKKDIEYPGYQTSRETYKPDLIELLNSFYPRTRFDRLRIRYDSSIDILNLTKDFGQ